MLSPAEAADIALWSRATQLPFSYLATSALSVHPIGRRTKRPAASCGVGGTHELSSETRGSSEEKMIRMLKYATWQDNFGLQDRFQ